MNLDFSRDVDWLKLRQIVYHGDGNFSTARSPKKLSPGFRFTWIKVYEAKASKVVTGDGPVQRTIEVSANLCL